MRTWERTNIWAKICAGAILIVVAVYVWLSAEQRAVADAALAGPVLVGDVEVARIDGSGNLERPVEIDTWVFLGSSLGMGYNGQVPFDPDTPGNFQTVLMEPAAYRHFQETGRFAAGSMFALYFHGSRTNVSINQSGFVMGEELALEIHLKDKKRFPETGFNFYFFGPDDQLAETQSAPNGCTSCHIEHGQTDGVFTQFYPALWKKLGEKSP